MLRVGLWVSALRELFMDRNARKQLENHAVSGVVYLVEAKVEKSALTVCLFLLLKDDNLICKSGSVGRPGYI